jgi:hypothetical protein
MFCPLARAASASQREFAESSPKIWQWNVPVNHREECSIIFSSSDRMLPQLRLHQLLFLLHESDLGVPFIWIDLQISEAF